MSNKNQIGRQWTKYTNIAAHTTCDWYVEQALDLTDLPDGTYFIETFSTNMSCVQNYSNIVILIQAGYAVMSTGMSIQGGAYPIYVSSFFVKQKNNTYNHMDILVYNNFGNSVTSGQARHVITKIA